MRMYDIIYRKRCGQALSPEEIVFAVDGYTKGDVPDYQMSALAMAVCLQGMNAAETGEFTLAMAHSGQQLDWSDIPGIKVDKHSTGGVGDTTTLVLAPWVAAAGVPIAKMSGRGLGHTGGTIDKLESIPGFRTDVTMSAFRAQVKDIGIAVAGQTADLAPADKKLYALRDVTATVDAIPLIASSIMSKKLASGADAIVLDVKVGDGAFMKDPDDARALAQTMVAIAAHAGRRATAVLTRMDEPLGAAIGNALEVREAILTLHGRGPADLTALCLTLGAEMVVAGGKAASAADARTQLEVLLANGAALDKLRQWITAQGGDARVVDDLSLLPQAPVVRSLPAWSSGTVTRMEAQAIGRVAMQLGAGREKHTDTIDPAVGLLLRRKVGQRVVSGEPLIEVHAATEADATAAFEALRHCITIGNGAPFELPLVLDTVRGGEWAATVSDQAGDAGDAAAREVSAAAREAGAFNASAPAATASAREAGAVGAGALSGAFNASAPAAGGVVTSSGAFADALQALLEQAKEARKAAYVPYSHFGVGAALQLADGRVILGANIENASYGLTNCAERTAVFRALMENNGTPPVVAALAVVADSQGPVAPCGACRQVLAEFCPPDTPILLGDLHGQTKQTTVSGLLPYAFGPAQMEQGE